ncbi:hypothetical protein ACLLKL_001997 [Escherichia coli]
MPAIVTLDAVERAKLIKLLNNLNLGFTFSGFGEAFVAMLDATPVHLTDEQKAELPTLINNLNLGFAHINAGELLVGLLDATTQQDTAKAMTASEVATLKDLLNRLNLGLHKQDVGGLVEAVVDHALAGNPVTVALAWDGAQPTAAKLGTGFNLKWKGGTGAAGKYDVTSTVGSEKPDQQTVTGQTATVTPDAADPTGDWVIVVTDNVTKETITTTVAVSAATPVLKTLKVASGTATDKLTVDNTDPAAPKVAMVTGTNGSVLVQVGTQAGATLGTLQLTNSKDATATATVDATNKAQINLVPVAAGTTNLTIKSGTVSIVLAITVTAP